MTSTVWITGGGAGIGRALALRLCRDGARVAISARTAESLDAVRDDAAGLPGQILPVPLDVTDREAVAEAAEAIEAEIGPLDLVVLNAGTHKPMPARDFSSEVFETLIAVNLMGVVHGLDAILPRFLERRSGQIAVVSSVAGYRGLPTAAAYGATKAALINMCEALKPELDAAGVSLSLINPGFVQTPLTDRNTFNMPFLISAENAAERIVAGLRKGKFEITFPRRFTWWLKLARGLPYFLFFRISRRMMP